MIFNIPPTRLHNFNLTLPTIKLNPINIAVSDQKSALKLKAVALEKLYAYNPIQNSCLNSIKSRAYPLLSTSKLWLKENKSNIVSKWVDLISTQTQVISKKAQEKFKPSTKWSKTATISAVALGTIASIAGSYYLWQYYNAGLTTSLPPTNEPLASAFNQIPNESNLPSISDVYECSTNFFTTSKASNPTFSTLNPSSISSDVGEAPSFSPSNSYFPTFFNSKREDDKSNYSFDHALDRTANFTQTKLFNPLLQQKKTYSNRLVSAYPLHITIPGAILILFIKKFLEFSQSLNKTTTSNRDEIKNALTTVGDSEFPLTEKTSCFNPIATNKLHNPTGQHEANSSRVDEIENILTTVGDSEFPLTEKTSCFNPITTNKLHNPTGQHEANSSRVDEIENVLTTIGDIRIKKISCFNPIATHANKLHNPISQSKRTINTSTGQHEANSSRVDEIENVLTTVGDIRIKKISYFNPIATHANKLHNPISQSKRTINTSTGQHEANSSRVDGIDNALTTVDNSKYPLTEKTIDFNPIAMYESEEFSEEKEAISKTMLTFHTEFTHSSDQIQNISNSANTHVPTPFLSLGELALTGIDGIKKYNQKISWQLNSFHGSSFSKTISTTAKTRRRMSCTDLSVAITRNNHVNEEYSSDEEIFGDEEYSSDEKVLSEEESIKKAIEAKLISLVMFFKIQDAIPEWEKITEITTNDITWAKKVFDSYHELYHFLEDFNQYVSNGANEDVNGKLNQILISSSPDEKDTLQTTLDNYNTLTKQVEYTLNTFKKIGTKLNSIFELLPKPIPTPSLLSQPAEDYSSASINNEKNEDTLSLLAKAIRNRPPIDVEKLEESVAKKREKTISQQPSMLQNFMKNVSKVPQDSKDQSDSDCSDSGWD